MEQIIDYLKQQYGQVYSIENGAEISPLINQLSLEERTELRSRLFHEARILELERRTSFFLVRILF